MTTEERLQEAVKRYRKNNPISVYQNIRNIEVIPSQIIFQNYKGSHVYNISFAVINVSKVIIFKYIVGQKSFCKIKEMCKIIFTIYFLLR